MKVGTARTRGDSDAALLARAAAGDARAVGLLYDRYCRVAFGLALAILRDEPRAQEVVAESFRSVLQCEDARAAAARGDALEPHLTRIVRTAALARCRDSASRRVDRGSPMRWGKSPSGDGGVGSLREAALAALSSLPPIQQRVLELAYFRGLAIREIATEILESEQRVATALRSALDALKRAAAIPSHHHMPR